MLDANDGQQLAEFRGHDVGVADVCWGQDGRTFFSADTGGNLRRWDARPPTSRSATLRTGYWTEKWIDMNQTRSVCVSADGQWFAAPETKNILRLTRVSGESSERRIEGSFPLGFTADNTRLSVLTMEGILKEFNLGQEGKVVRETPLLTPADTPLNFAALSADRDTLVASAQSGKLWTWHFPSGKLIVETDLKRASVWSVLSPSGKLVALAARDNVVRVLASATGLTVAEAAGGGSRRGFFGGAFSPDERQLAVCTENGLVEIRALPSFEITQRLRTDSTTLYSLQFSPDGTRLYCGGSNGTVQVYATDDWRLIVTLLSPPSAQYRDTTVLTMGINASGTALLGYRADGTIRIWNSVTPN
jgi:WD40 repeat protein